MARASLRTDGFMDLLDRLEKSSESLQRRAARALDEEFKRQMSGTTIGSTGRLHASLTTNNADHIFTLGAGGIKLGSRDPAARYSSRSIPPIVPAPFYAILAAMLFRNIRSGGANRAR
jgi:hypothetical protein